MTIASATSRPAASGMAVAASARATPLALMVVIGRSALQGGHNRHGLRVAGGLDDLAADDAHDVHATNRFVRARTPYVAPADECPLVAGVDVLDLEVTGGVVDERLP